MVRKNDPTAPSGILIIDKPAGMTSHDVVAKIRKIARTRKVGHAGTLDPMATGVLVLGLGKATRLLTWLTGNDKSYDATVRFGLTTTTEDHEGVLTSSHGCEKLTEEDVEKAMSPLRGDIMQVPSSVSAIKIDGKRAHALVREGQDVTIPPRPVHIATLERCSDIRQQALDVANKYATTTEHDQLSGPIVSVCDVDIHAVVSSGTYVRALARDMGNTLGCGAHLTALRRTRVGAFPLETAQNLEDLEKLAEEHHHNTADENGQSPRPKLPIITLDDAVATMFETVTLDEKETRLFSNGQAPRRDEATIRELQRRAGENPIGVIAADGHTAMGLMRVQGKKLVTVLVFAG